MPTQFGARAGEEIVFQVVARPIGSRLDSVIRVRDANGKVIAENNDFDLNRDSTLTWRFAETGNYVLTLEDIEHGGAKNGFAYRIYAGAQAHLASLFPLRPLPGPAMVRKLAELARYTQVLEAEPNRRVERRAKTHDPVDGHRPRLGLGVRRQRQFRTDRP